MNAVEINLEKMVSREKGGMMKLLSGESIAGNAGREGDMPCAGANFYFDPKTGLIERFANYRPENKDLSSATFRVTVNMNAKRWIDMYKIISLTSEEDMSEQARSVLEESKKQYNRLQ